MTYADGVTEIQQGKFNTTFNVKKRTIEILTVDDEDVTITIEGGSGKDMKSYHGGVKYMKSYGGDGDGSGRLGFSGRGKLTRFDGAVFEGPFVNGKFQSTGVVKIPCPIGNGQSYIYEGEWRNGKKHGDGAVTFSGGAMDGYKFESTWKRDNYELERRGTLYDSNGKPTYTGTFKKVKDEYTIFPGMFHGKGIKFFDLGISLVGGTGKFTENVPNGKLE